MIDRTIASTGLPPRLQSATATWLRTGHGRVAAAVVALGCVGYVGLVNAHSSSAPLPRCPVHAVTGLYCPGCGGLRAVHDLVRLHPVAALHDNAFLLAALPVLAIVAGQVLTGRPVRVPRALGLAVLVVAVVWTVVRNLPAFPWQPGLG